MGRLDHLARLALGRSAFQDNEADPPLAHPTEHDRAHEISRAGDAPGQAFDSKGRPSRPETEASNAAQRKAQNAVLALVGVVESRDTADRLAEAKYREIRRARQNVLLREQDYGEILDVLATLSREAGSWWTHSLTAKLQAGLYSTTARITCVLLDQVRITGTEGWRHALAMAFAGAPACFIHGFLRTLLGGLLEEAISRLQSVIVRQSRRSKTANRINVITLIICDVLLIGVDALLLPLDFYGAAQQLGLAPAWPLLPGWRAFNPWHLTSVHQLSGFSTSPYPVMRYLWTPSALMLIRNFIGHKNEETPILRLVTPFKYASIDTLPTRVRAPDARRDPWGALLYRLYIARCTFLQWCGWKIEKIHSHPSRNEELENNRYTNRLGSSTANSNDNTNQEDEQSRPLVHRSTALAHLPAQYLADVIDDLFARLVTLPLSCITYSTIAASYLASPLPQTKFALSVRPQFPSSTFAVHGWRGFGNYIGKVGLGVALQTTVEVGLFFGIYRLVRWYGTEQFDWGRRGKIGTVAYWTPNLDDPE